MSNYTSYTDVLKQAPATGLCCECGCVIGRDQWHWELKCKDGRKSVLYPTCQICHDIRQKYLTEVFTPTMLEAEIRALRAKVSYDDTYNWAQLTNALGELLQRRRQAQQRCATPPAPALTPTPLRCSRPVLGGWRG